MRDTKKPAFSGKSMRVTFQREQLANGGELAIHSPILNGYSVATELDPPAFAYAIMRTESAFRVDAESWANAIGLLQLLVPTARGLVRPGRKNPIEGA